MEIITYCTITSWHGTTTIWHGTTTSFLSSTLLVKFQLFCFVHIIMNINEPHHLFCCCSRPDGNQAFSQLRLKAPCAKLYFAFKLTLIKVHNIVNKVFERITCNQKNQTQCINKVTNSSLSN